MASRFAPRSRDRMMGKNAQPLSVFRQDFSGGQNTRIEPSLISENQLTVGYNADLGIPGRTDKRPGLTLIANTVGTRTYALAPYYPTSGTDALYRIEGTNTRKWTGSGNWSSNLQTFTTSLDTTIIQAGQSGSNEVLFYQNGTDQPYVMTSTDTFTALGAGATSPVKTLNNIFLNNRWWELKDGFLYYSSAFPSDYSTAFSSSNGFRFSGYGGDRGLIAIRDVDTSLNNTIIVLLQKGIWGLAPSPTPVSTDRPFLITSAIGAVEHKCVVQSGDDIIFLAADGIRSLKRTAQDKLQVENSYPLSYVLKDEFENIDWSQSSKFHMVAWQNKVFFFFVQTGGTDINRCWVYWPALDPDKTGKAWSVITGWTVTATAKFFLNGKENLYGGSTDGSVYQLWSGTGDDNGTAINLQLETRDEDFEHPEIYKYGGEIEVRCSTTSSAQSITVYALIDGGSYTTLGTITLTASGPALPQNLPFYLVDNGIVSQKFHLDSLGRFKTIRFKFQHNTTNTTDTIRLLSYGVITYPDVYNSED